MFFQKKKLTETSHFITKMKNLVDRMNLEFLLHQPTTKL
jgi:hypothetical protein